MQQIKLSNQEWSFLLTAAMLSTLHTKCQVPFGRLDAPLTNLLRYLRICDIHISKKISIKLAGRELHETKNFLFFVYFSMIGRYYVWQNPIKIPTEGKKGKLPRSSWELLGTSYNKMSTMSSCRHKYLRIVMSCLRRNLAACACF